MHGGIIVPPSSLSRAMASFSLFKAMFSQGTMPYVLNMQKLAQNYPDHSTVILYHALLSTACDILYA